MNREFPFLVSYAYDLHRNCDTPNHHRNDGRLQAREGKVRQVNNEFGGLLEAKEL